MRILMLFWGLFLTIPETFAQILDVRNFNILSSTTLDQTDRINNFIKQNPGKTIHFSAGVYLVKKLSISNNIILTGSDATIRGTTDNTGPLIDIRAGNVTIKQLRIDAVKKRQIGIYIYTGESSISIENCVIENVQGSPAPSHGYGIQIRRNLREVKITGTKVSNVSGPGTGTVADVSGHNRGIYINNVNTVLVSGCTIADIQGYKEGEGLQYYRWKENSIADSFTGNVTIENNEFKNICKRGIRINADNTIVRNNKFYNLRLDNMLSYSAISVYGHNNLIKGNEIEMNYAAYGIEIAGCRNTMLLENKISVKKFYSNVIAPILLSNLQGIRVYNNYFNGKLLSSPQILKKGTNVDVSGN